MPVDLPPPLPQSPPAIVSPAAPADIVEAEIGANLDGNLDWSAAHVWADAARLFRTWGKINEPWNPLEALPLTADGYPLGDCDALSYLNNYPNGPYKLTYVGSGEMAVGGIGRLMSMHREGNRVTADVLVRHDAPDETGGILYLGVRNVLVSDPIHDVHLWAPGYGPGDVFTKDFVRRVRPFRCIRFMDWAGTNNSLVAHWADRTQPTAMMQTVKGVDWESVIALANAVHRDVWINVPDMADDDYVQHLALLFKEKLDPALSIRLEYSNEVWNAIFKQFHRNLAAAKSNPELTASDDFTRCAQQYAVRAAHVGRIFRETLGTGRTGRLIVVYGGQNSNTHWVQAGLEHIKSKYGDPKEYFQEVAIAPYVGNDLPREPLGGWTLDQLFPELDKFMDTTLAGWIRDARRVADAYGMGLVAYEGGQHLSGNPHLAEPLARAAQDDPRMYALYHKLMAVWRANGGGLFEAFSHMGTGGWALLEDPARGGSRKWDAVMDMLLPRGDVTLDGQVTYDDFLVIKEHYHQPGRWWREQGDLNGDNVVDAKDLDILIAALKARGAEVRPSVIEEIEAWRKANP